METDVKSLDTSGLSTPITSLETAPPSGSDVHAGLLPAGNKSYVSGRQDLPLMHKTIPQLFADTVASHGWREAAVFCQEGIRWSYKDLANQVDDLAAGLRALGMERGDRLGIWSPNRPEWLVTQLATARIGVMLVNINPAYQLVELEYALNKSSSRALIVAERFKKSDYLGMLQSLAPELERAEPGKLVAQRLPHLRVVIRCGAKKSPGMLNYADVLKLGGPAHRNDLDALSATLDPDDPINIQFTSGTTGLPKGATLTHKNITNNAMFVGAAMRFTEQDRLCIAVPLYHCFGMVMGNLTCICTGSKMVFPGEGFDPGDTLAAIAKERCTAVHGVPTMFVAELAHPQFADFDFSSLRTGIMAGAPCPVKVMEEVMQKMHMKEVTIAYGMTETSPVSFQSATDDPINKRVSSVGRVQPHVEVKLVDDNDAIVPVGVKGELCTRGYLVMHGYWDDEEQTKAVLVNGWMHTGDLAVMDKEGYTEIVGRVKDMVIRGGENIYPREIEEFLFRHPKVKQVQAFGVPDAKYGEELCCWIILHHGETAEEEEIRSYCRGQISHFKIPRHMRFVDEIPMTVTGKPQKYLMRDTMIAELASGKTD